ncbi:hypothetical protein LQU94_06045 [Peptoniphilus sp. KCTC 25270]|uniref:hypothetical protein n=1 Tax=Peptoniphilus sp. KCTC 25270 TaxID=2897414 RepID=UPI001E4554E1|nr:hypothetical protein [Peptoniphilus sp. KCTC 25270]MCD1147671.1 hypothetical protein [Peptoniphilus sp. KCTC 25270]
MKEHIKTVVLAMLVALTLYMANVVWLKAPPETEILLSPERESQGISQELEESIKPYKTLINFGGKEHAIVYQVENMWPFYQNMLKQSFPENRGTSIVWKEISSKEYIRMHQEPSIVFDFGNEVYSNLFKEIYHLDNSQGKVGNEIQEIYFSANGSSVVLVTEEGYFQNTLSDVSVQGVERYFQSLKEEQKYVPYRSTNELYGSENLVYLPQGPLPFTLRRVYENGIKTMEPNNVNEMVERFLGSSFDEIHVIEEENSTLYVNGQKTLRITNNGVVIYRDESEKRSVDTKGIEAIEIAKNFMESKTGITKELYLDSLKEIRRNDKQGYRVRFNYLENNYVVYPVGEESVKSFIEVQVVDNSVVQLIYVLRGSVKLENQPIDVQAYKSIQEIIEQNQEEIGLRIGKPGSDVEDIYRELKGWDLCLMDEYQEDEFPLTYVYCVEFEGITFYYHGITGELVMIR